MQRIVRRLSTWISSILTLIQAAEKSRCDVAMAVDKVVVMSRLLLELLSGGCC